MVGNGFESLVPRVVCNKLALLLWAAAGMVVKAVHVDVEAVQVVYLLMEMGFSDWNSFLINLNDI